MVEYPHNCVINKTQFDYFRFMYLNTLSIKHFQLFRLLFCTALISASLSFTTLAENSLAYDFQHLSTEIGLSNNEVLSILQDQYGFMWFGTANGLNRYNGNSFRIFKYDPDNPNSISSNFIASLLEDSNGNLWIGTNRGLNRLNTQTGVFTKFQHNTEEISSLSNNYIQSLLEDAKGDIWVGTRGGGLNRISANQKTNGSIHFEHIKLNTSQLLPNSYIETIHQDDAGNIWIGTESNLILISHKNDTDHAHIRYFLLRDVPNKTILNISEGKNHHLLVTFEEGGVWEFKYSPLEKDSITFNQINFDQPCKAELQLSFISAMIDSKGNLWRSSRGGGAIFVPDYIKGANRSIKFVPQHNKNGNSLSGNYINGVFEDRTGDIWIYTQNSGIDKYEPGPKPFKILGKNDIHITDIQNVESIIEDVRGDLIIAAGGYGLFKYAFYDRTALDGKLERLNWVNSINIQSIIEDNEGNFWITAGYNGIQAVNKQGIPIQPFISNENDSNVFSHNYAYKLFQDSRGLIWIGSRGDSKTNGLNYYNPSTKKLTSFNNKSVHNDLNQHIVISSITEDHLGQIWAGTKSAGVILLEIGDSGTFQSRELKNIPGDKTSLNDDHINAIFSGSNNTLWVSTESGLNKYNFKTQNFVRINPLKNKDLPSVFGIEEDNDGTLWLGTIKGLVKYDPNKNQALEFDRNDGLHSTGYQTILKLSKRNGIVFGGKEGCVLYDPLKIKKNNLIPPVVISDIQIFNLDPKKSKNNTLQFTIHTKDEIVLPFNENSFSLQFAALSYTKQSKNRYAYRLDGFDREGQWIYPKAGQQSVNYSNLMEGEYLFQLKASNNDGIWNEEGKSLRIIVLPPFYRTKAAYIFYFFFISGLLYLFIRLMVKQGVEKNRLKMERIERRKIEELNQLKLKFFTDISHEFRTPLTLIIAPIERLLKPSSQISETKRNELYIGIHKNANRLLRLINELMDFRKMESGKLKLKAENNDIIGFLQGIYSSFIHTADERKIVYLFSAFQNKLDVYFDADKFEKVMYNLLSNAFKNTPDQGRIELSVSAGEHHVQIKVCDNGKGIPEKDLANIFEHFYQAGNSHSRSHFQPGTGIGLTFTKSLIEMHKGQISVESKVNENTCFTITLPLGNSHLNPEEIIRTSETGNMDSFVAKKTQRKAKEQPVQNQLENRKYTKPHLLIVDDNDEIRAFLKSEFKADYHISEAVNGEEGLAKAYHVNPDLILSDVMMPVMDGFEFCRHLKTNFKTSHIPVVLLTAKSTNKSLIEGLETGADAYISKPFNMNVLEVRVRKLLESRRKLRELYSNSLQPDPRALVTNRVDEAFLSKAISVVEENLDNADFNLDDFCLKLGISKASLQNKLKALTGKSTGEFIRSIRLKHAARLLKEGNLNITEICYSVGFSTLWYFSKCFKKEYQVLPSEFMKPNNQ